MIIFLDEGFKKLRIKTTLFNLMIYFVSQCLKTAFFVKLNFELFLGLI